MKYGDYIVVRAKRARGYASVLVEQMIDTVETLIEKGQLDERSRITLSWTIQGEANGRRDAASAGDES